MKVLIFYRLKSEQARIVEDFIHEFGRLHPDSELTVVDVDTIDGISKTQVYDIMKFPTLIAASNDGRELQRWSNDELPLMSEIAYYANL